MPSANQEELQEIFSSYKSVDSKGFKEFWEQYQKELERTRTFGGFERYVETKIRYSDTAEGRATREADQEFTKRLKTHAEEIELFLLLHPELNWKPRNYIRRGGER